MTLNAGTVVVGADDEMPDVIGEDETVVDNRAVLVG